MSSRRILVPAVLVALLATPALAQNTLNWPVGEFMSYPLDSGVLSNPTTAPVVVYADTVTVADAAWIRLYFGTVQLEDGSAVRMTSLLDNEVQELNPSELEMWHNTSAYFNGASVYLEIIAGPQTTNRLILDRVAVFIGGAGPRACGVDGCGICGTDDRVPSTEDWSGRILPVGCTGSVYNQYSCVVSAGHCADGGSDDVIQFRVPNSSSNCNLVNPGVADQFPITGHQFVNGGVGNDWAVMTTGTNSSGQTIYARYGVFRPIATTVGNVGDTVAVWGYGVDDSPDPTRNQTQQTSTGQVNGRTSTYYTHSVDISYGNSGSGLIRNDEIIGIITHCDYSCSNIATRVDLAAFAAARQALCPDLTPINDACENAIAVANGGTYPGSTANASNDGSASCGTSTTAKDVWYAYTAVGTGNLTVSTCTGSSYDTVLSVHSGCPGTTANELGCNDNGCATNKSTVTVAVTTGNTYYIRVAGHGTASGSYTLTVAGPADTTPPTPNPMLFASPPAPSPTSPTTAVEMTAATASDPSGGIEYAFEADTGPGFPGALASDWDASATYTNTGLTPNTLYTYRAKARDGLGNVTTPSADASAVTYIETPTGVTYGTTAADSIELFAAGNLPNLTLGSSGTYFDCVTTGGQGGIEAWVSGGTDTATGLSMNTSYTFRVKARNQNGIETPYSGMNSQVTAMATPTGITFGTLTLSSIVLNADGSFLNINTGSSGLYFDSTTTGGDGGIDAWVQATTDTATGLSTNTVYVFQVKARNQVGAETPYCTPVPKATRIETPTGVAYGAVTSSSIDLNATGTLSNLTLGSSGVYFDSTTTGGNGGIDEWIQATTDTATGLTPDTSYTFRVRARNQDALATLYSASSSQRTRAAIPAAPLLANATPNSMTLDVQPNGNPASTVFAIQCTAATPADANWVGQYVSATGTHSAIAVWQTDGTWAIVTIQGLAQNTTYTFAVKARNGDGIETAFGPGASLTTGALTGACCNPTTGACTIATQADCVAGGGIYKGDSTGCTPNPCTLPTGACCNPTTGACTIATQTDCVAGGGIYQGDNTGCTPNPCTQPTGACCNPTTGACTIATQADCVAGGGLYQGDSTVCAPNPCTQPTGACCNPTTGACTIATQTDCVAGGGIYQGDSTACTPNPCEQPCTLLGDVNQDGAVNGLDIDGFIRAKLGLPAQPGEDPACADYGTGTLSGDIDLFVADLLG